MAFRRFWFKAPRHSKQKSAKMCYLYHTTRRETVGCDIDAQGGGGSGQQRISGRYVCRVDIWPFNSTCGSWLRTGVVGYGQQLLSRIILSRLQVLNRPRTGWGW